jgi:peptidoglycan/xylan/chitin deacetylase (PgdA/CDA1 family)
MIIPVFLVLLSSVFAQVPPPGSPLVAGVRVTNVCTVPGTVAFTFDDGPYLYTQNIAEAFSAAGGNVTFFVNGLNFGCIYERAEQLKRAFDLGHQIASHTWSHPDLQTLSAEGVTLEMEKLSQVLVKIIGAAPVYMRPPYGSYNEATLTALGPLGFTTLSMWDVDSGDSLGVPIGEQQTRYNALPLDVSHNILHHETKVEVADVMVTFAIEWARTRGLKMVTVAQCLGDAAPPYKNVLVAESRNPSWIC